MAVFHERRTSSKTQPHIWGLMALAIIVSGIIIVLGPGEFIPKELQRALERTGQNIQIVVNDTAISEGGTPPVSPPPDLSNHTCVFTGSSERGSFALTSIANGATAFLIESSSGLIAGFWIEGNVAHLVRGTGDMLHYGTIDRAAFEKILQPRHGGNQIAGRIQAAMSHADMKNALPRGELREAFRKCGAKIYN